MLSRSIFHEEKRQKVLGIEGKFSHPTTPCCTDTLYQLRRLYYSTPPGILEYAL